MRYKNHEISETKNEYGYFEAVPDDCNAPMFYNKSIAQTFRRLRQLLDNSWGKLMRNCDHQLMLINKLYQRNGLELKMTCPACPEQYEIFKDGNQIAYYRLRHGAFTVNFPDHMGKTILEIDVVGDGIFDESERLVCLTRAMRLILKELEITSRAST